MSLWDLLDPISNPSVRHFYAGEAFWEFSIFLTFYPIRIKSTIVVNLRPSSWYFDGMTATTPKIKCVMFLKRMSRKLLSKSKDHVITKNLVSHTERNQWSHGGESYQNNSLVIFLVACKTCPKLNFFENHTKWTIRYCAQTERQFISQIQKGLQFNHLFPW